jgi:hypothetical protein
MAQEEGGDGASVTRQEFAVGSTVHAVVSLLDSLFGGEFLLVGGIGSADTQQAGDLGNLESSVAVEEEMTEQARGVVVSALLLAEAEDSSEQSLQLGSETVGGNVSLFDPGSEVLGCYSHGTASRANSLFLILLRLPRKVTGQARKTVWC